MIAISEIILTNRSPLALCSIGSPEIPAEFRRIALLATDHLGWFRHPTAGVLSKASQAFRTCLLAPDNWGQGDLNPHSSYEPNDFKSCASTDSAMPP